jgi:hypothetical protein
MVLTLNGKFLCSSKATYGHGGDAGEEAITEMTYCKGPIPIKKGDTLTFTAQYDFSKHKRYATYHFQGLLFNTDDVSTAVRAHLVKMDSSWGSGILSLRLRSDEKRRSGTNTSLHRNSKSRSYHVLY